MAKDEETAPEATTAAARLERLFVNNSLGLVTSAIGTIALALVALIGYVVVDLHSTRGELMDVIREMSDLRVDLNNATGNLDDVAPRIHAIAVCLADDREAQREEWRRALEDIETSAIRGEIAPVMLYELVRRVTLSERTPPSCLGIAPGITGQTTVRDSQTP